MTRLIRFPWRLFWQFYSVQMLAYNLTFLLTLSVISGHRPFGEVYFWSILGQYLMVTALIAAVVSWRFIRPLHKVILKAFRVASKKMELVGEDLEDDLMAEEMGEYSQIENALNRI